MVSSEGQARMLSTKFHWEVEYSFWAAISHMDAYFGIRGVINENDALKAGEKTAWLFGSQQCLLFGFLRNNVCEVSLRNFRTCDTTITVGFHSCRDFQLGMC